MMIRIGSMLTIIILLIACRSNEKVQDEKVVEQIENKSKDLKFLLC